jgi:NAD(P)-dependent dehydrogenase (short-subunit alcohol dehydrogenase family)
MTWTIENKTVLVTGATSGIGRATARALAQGGAHLILIGRNPQRGAETREEVLAASKSGKVDLLLADLSVMEEVRRLAADVRRRYDRLEVLINNAGALFMKRDLTADGLERTFAVNHLAYFLLTNLLLDLLKQSAPARIINVSSAVHARGHLDFGDLMHEQRWGGFRAYCDSKLANVLFTRALAARLDGTGVTVNALHPGAVASSFGHHNGTVASFMLKLARPFLLSEERGAATTIYLATSPDVEGVTGKYFARQREARVSREARDDEVGRRLWQVSEQLVQPA